MRRRGDLGFAPLEQIDALIMERCDVCGDESIVDQSTAGHADCADEHDCLGMLGGRVENGWPRNRVAPTEVVYGDDRSVAFRISPSDSSTKVRSKTP